MFSHVICSKILMIVVLTYSVSRGPNSANAIFGIAHFGDRVYVLLYTHARSHTQKAEWEKSNEAGEGSREQVLWGAAEGAGAV